MIYDLNFVTLFVILFVIFIQQGCCILDDGAPSDCCNEDDLATLMYAVIINNTNVVHILVQKGIGVDV